MCVQCGTCVKNCPTGALSMGADGKVKFDPAKCVQCDTCIHVCPNDSSPRTCEMTPEEVYERVKKQIPFIRGISVSGGECMLQPEFLTELFRLAKKDGLGTLIDSNGMVPFENYPELMEVADGVMLDIKAFEAEEHKKVAEQALQLGCEEVWFVGEEFQPYAEGARWFPDVEAVKTALTGGNQPVDRLILIKGSNGTKLFQLPALL